MFDQLKQEIRDFLEKEKLPQFVISTTYNDVEANLIEETVDIRQSLEQIISKQKQVNGVCVTCMQGISDSEFLQIGQFNYHWNCVKCSKCNLKLTSETIVLKTDDVLCSNCEKALFISCKLCRKPITSSNYFTQSVDETVYRWHFECYTCSTPSCDNKQISYVKDMDALICQKHLKNDSIEEDSLITSDLRFSTDMRLEEISDNESETSETAAIIDDYDQKQFDEQIKEEKEITKDEQPEKSETEALERLKEESKILEKENEQLMQKEKEERLEKEREENRKLEKEMEERLEREREENKKKLEKEREEKLGKEREEAKRLEKELEEKNNKIQEETNLKNQIKIEENIEKKEEEIKIEHKEEENPKVVKLSTFFQDFSTSMICYKCEKKIQGSYMKSSINTYHPWCFKCHTCEIIIESFYQSDTQNEKEIIYCKNHAS